VLILSKTSTPFRKFQAIHSLSRIFREKQHLRPCFQSIQIITPLLHHLLPLFKVRGPVVCSAVRIAHGMRKLVLNVLWPDVEDFVDDRTRPYFCP
jgi:hypothetical protein